MPILRPLLLILLFACPARAQMTWSLASGNESWPADKRAAIIAAMDSAVALYNANGYFPKTLWANYSPGVPTAQASYSGWIDFGGSIGTRVALHEISHTLGVGQVAAWNTNRSGNTWTGTHAINRVKLFDGASATLSADAMHFWPYGLNYDTEDGTTNRVRHIKMVSAMRRDMGIVSDSDNDGIPNDWEMFYFGDLTQTATGDADGDGVNNLTEYNADTNPALAIFHWTGSSSSDWTVAGNWSTAAGPSSGTYFARLNVNNALNQPLIYDVSRGTTLYRPAERGLVIASGATGSGALSITGGIFSTVGCSMPDVLGNTGNTGTLTISGGSFSSAELHLGVLGTGTGNFNIQGGSASVTSLVYRFGIGGTGIVNLDGGTLSTAGISRGIDNSGNASTGSAQFRFNGGTLRATAANVDFLEGLTTAHVRAGGAKIDTNGFPISIAQPLLNDVASPSGGLVKSGNGTLTLPVANTFTGETQVAAGTLLISNAGGLGTAGTGTTISSGATLALSNNITTAAGESIAIAGAGEGSRGALQSNSGTNTWSGPVSVTASNTRIGVQNGSALTVSGNITEAAAGTSIIFRAGAASGSDVMLSGTANFWTGATSVFSDSATAGLVELGADNAIPPTLLQVAGSSVAGRLDLNGFDLTVTGLTTPPVLPPLERASSRITAPHFRC